MPNLPVLTTTDQKMRLVAREVAMDIMEAQAIAEKLCDGIEEWDLIVSQPKFRQYLAEAKEQWNSSLNTKERVEVMTWQILEDALLQFQAYLHSPSFSDTAKVQLYQALQKQVGVGVKENMVAGSGERFQININLGGDVTASDVTSKGKTIEEIVVQDNT